MFVQNLSIVKLKNETCWRYVFRSKYIENNAATMWREITGI